MTEQQKLEAALKVLDNWDGVVDRCRNQSRDGHPCATCVTRRQVIEDFRAALTRGKAPWS